MLDILDGDGTRPVYWVGSPTIQDKRKDAGASQINDVARSVIRSHKDVTYVDAYKLFSGPDGKFAPNLPGVNGKTVRVRAGDGLHLTPAGGDLLAKPIFDLIDARCKLEEQAVPDHTQPVIQTKGSGQVPGTHREHPDAACDHAINVTVHLRDNAAFDGGTDGFATRVASDQDRPVALGSGPCPTR